MKLFVFAQREFVTFSQEMAKKIGATYIVTNAVGPCAVLFVKNTKKNTFYAIHGDATTSFNAIKASLMGFLSTEAGPENFQAHLVGGWRGHEIKFAEPLASFLQAIKIPLDQSLFNIRAPSRQLYEQEDLSNIDISNHYPYVGINPETMEPKIFTEAPEEIELLTDRVPEVQQYVDQCLQYSYHNIILTASYYYKDLLFPNVTGSDQFAEFFETVVNSSNGTPLVPRLHTINIAKAQVEALKKAISENNASEFTKLLQMTFVSPFILIPGDTGKTLLQTACDKFSQNPASYELQAIIFLLIIKVRASDIKAHAAAALETLPDSNFKNACLKIIDKLQTCNLVSSPRRTITTSTACQLHAFLVVRNIFAVQALSRDTAKRLIEETIFDAIHEISQEYDKVAPAALVFSKPQTQEKPKQEVQQTADLALGPASILPLKKRYN